MYCLGDGCHKHAKGCQKDGGTSREANTDRMPGAICSMYSITQNGGEAILDEGRVERRWDRRGQEEEWFRARRVVRMLLVDIIPSSCV